MNARTEDTEGEGRGKVVKGFPGFTCPLQRNCTISVCCPQQPRLEFKSLKGNEENLQAPDTSSCYSYKNYTESKGTGGAKVAAAAVWL